MEKINILIVDESLENIAGLEAFLQRADTNMISTSDPAEAIRLSQEMNIAIAMIYVGGTGMGLELAKVLKSSPHTEEILILFLTVETKNTFEGLSAGTFDYPYKPLSPSVTSAKIDLFIELIRNRREIKKKNKELKTFQEDLMSTLTSAEPGKGIEENLLTNMSDEIRPPINGIIGVTQLLKKTTLTDEQREMVNLLEISSNSLLGVINEVSDLSKIGSGKVKINRIPTDLTKTLSKETTVNKNPMEESLTPLDNIRILVAEDNPINKFLIIKILQNWQIEADVVENGEKALEKLREKDYNLILMDTYMPVMNGLEAIKLIREGYASGKENIPIITFSAAIMEADKETALAAGANDVISKPLEPAALHKKILEYTIG